MSQNIADEFSSDEVTVYKDEGETEEVQVAGENFGIDKETLIKEAEQISVKSSDVSSKPAKDVPFNERSTPGTNRQINNVSGLFDNNGALSPSAAGLLSASSRYAALLTAGGLAGSLSPATLGFLAAANSQPAASPAPLSTDHVSALMAGVASPPAQLAAAMARSSPALAALQIAAALQPYSNSRSNAGSSTPAASTTPGVSSSGEALGAMAAAAGLQQLAAAAVAAQSPPVWPNSNSSAASNWLYGTGVPPALSGNPVAGSITSPALAAAASPALLARLSPALSTLSCLAAAANIPSSQSNANPASFLLNASTTQPAVPSPSSATSSVQSSNATDATTSLATEVIMLRAAMAQQQQQHQQQFASVLDAAQQVLATQQPGNAPVTPRAKHVTMPTPTSRPRPPQSGDQNLTPMAGTSIAGVKRPHPALTHREPQDQHSPAAPMMAQSSFHPLAQQSPGRLHPSAFSSLDPRRQAHLVHQQQLYPPGLAGQHPGGPRSPPNPNEPHIKKPLNAFMLFMKEQRAKVIAECTLKESAAINQILGQRWHNLSRDEQARYYDMAKAEKERHQQLYPNWSARENYASHAKRKRKKKLSHAGYAGYHGQLAAHGLGPDGTLKDPRDSALKKCRARYGVDQMDKWCKPCRRKKKCARYYNLPGADDDNDGGTDAKSTPSSHHSLAPGMLQGVVPMSGAGHAYGPPAFGGQSMVGLPPDEWSDSDSSIGDSEDDEDQLNAFHLVTESSSASSTPSPTPPVLAPLSPTSSITSSASHVVQQQVPPGFMSQLPKVQPGTPVIQGPEALLFAPMAQQSLAASLAPDIKPVPFLHQAAQAPPAPASSSSASSEVVQPPQMPTTPPPTGSAPGQQLLCSPNSSNTGMAFRPLLPAN